MQLTQDRRTLRQLHRPTYTSWRGMLDRRKRGYRVHGRWLDFAAFLDDMGPRPGTEYTLDRKDPGNPLYGPGLCEWRDKRHQSRNRSATIHLTDRDGTTLPLATWADLKGVSADTMRKRRRRGWPDGWVINGRPEGEITQRASSLQDDVALVASLPYPVDGADKKLRWERLYRESGHDGESRLEYFIRTCRTNLDQLADKLDDRPPEMAVEPSSSEAGVVDYCRKIIAAIERAEVLLAEEMGVEEMKRQPRLGKKRVAKILKTPGNLGREAERRLDALTFGYADRESELDPGPTGVIDDVKGDANDADHRAD